MDSGDSVTPAFLLTLFVIVPLLSIRGYYRLRSDVPFAPKKNSYASAIVQFIPMAVFALFSQLRQELALFSRKPSVFQCTAGIVLVLGYGLHLRRNWHRISLLDKQLLRKILPATPGELRYWVWVSLMAGIVEEYAYRGVAYSAVLSMSNSVLFATFVCSIAFAAAHLYQGWKAVLTTMMVGLILQALVVWTGSIYLSIAVHAFYDGVIGIVSTRMFMREETVVVAVAQSHLHA